MKIDKDHQALHAEGPTDGGVINKLVLLGHAVDLSHLQARIVRTEGGDDEQGVDAAIERFAVGLKVQRPNRLGLVIDRDALDGKPDRWTRVRKVLSASSLPAPEAPSDKGYLELAPWGQHVGVWLWPDNVRAGDLETLLAESVPADSADWPHARDATSKAKELGARFKEVHRRKAELHTWLSWRDPPGNPFGTAIQAQALAISTPGVAAFLAWFERLYLTD